MPGPWHDWPLFFLFPGAVWLGWFLLKKIPRTYKFSVIAEGVYDRSVHRCHEIPPPFSPIGKEDAKGRKLCFSTIYLKDGNAEGCFVRGVCELKVKPGMQIKILGNGRGEYKIEFIEDANVPA